ncbi:organic cation transporter protein-like [Oppia nitens]|uniref:organic cation transporter protein-like n=1 Tax=Oppia nitens TaxID=1686743 RepID=UPI0023DA30D4|nr:organic cation transporter protein-like [Oppia nitens]
MSSLYSISVKLSALNVSNVWFSCLAFDSTEQHIRHEMISSAKQDTHSTENCDHYVYDKREFHSTIVTEWDIVCDNSWKLPLSQSGLMIGVLLGNLIFGLLSDRYGRKAPFTIAPVICLITTIAIAFSPNLIVFTILTALTALSASGMSQSAFIIGVELIGDKYRVLCVNFQQVIYSTGTILLCLTAYYVRQWRDLQFMIAIPAALLLPLIWLFPESFRWQLSNGKVDSALNVLRRAAHWNGIQLNESEFCDSKILNDSTDFSQKSCDIQTYGPFCMFTNKTVRFWTFSLLFIWVIVSMIYYGLSFQSQNLGTNTYLTLAAIAAIDIPANIMVTVMLNYFGRKKVLFLLSLMAGVSCLTAVVIPHDSQLVTLVAILGKCMISASYTLLYIYTAEIYPTPIRSTSVGVFQTFSRIGGIIAPHLIELSSFGQNMPLIACGLLALGCCLLAMNLPETHNRQLPETFEDTADLRKQQQITITNDCEKSHLIPTDNKNQFYG